MVILILTGFFIGFLGRFLAVKSFRLLSMALIAVSQVHDLACISASSNVTVIVRCAVTIVACHASFDASMRLRFSSHIPCA